MVDDAASEDDVEALVRKRHGLGIHPYEARVGETEFYRAARRAVSIATLRDVDAGERTASARQHQVVDRQQALAATVVEHILAADGFQQQPGLQFRAMSAGGVPFVEMRPGMYVLREALVME